MNARQMKKRLKKRIQQLQSDNRLMRDIISDSPAMQELYDKFTKPVPYKISTMQFQEYRVKRTIPPYMTDVLSLTSEGVIEHTKQVAARELFEGIKDSINYEFGTEHFMPTVTASIFIGMK